MLFQIITTASIYLSDLCNLRFLLDACIRISYFNITSFFKYSLIKVEEVFLYNTGIVFNDWFKKESVIVFSRINCKKYFSSPIKRSIFRFPCFLILPMYFKYR